MFTHKKIQLFKVTFDTKQKVREVKRACDFIGMQNAFLRNL